MQQVDTPRLYDCVVVRFRDLSGRVREIEWSSGAPAVSSRRRVEDLSACGPMSEAAARYILHSWAQISRSVQPA